MPYFRDEFLKRGMDPMSRNDGDIEEAGCDEAISMRLIEVQASWVWLHHIPPLQFSIIPAHPLHASLKKFISKVRHTRSGKCRE